MATCKSATLSGLAFDCEGSKGGIKAVWLAPYVESNKPTVTDNVITEIPGKNDFKKYYFRKNTATMTSTLTVDDQNGVHYVDTELQLTFTRMEAAKRVEIEAMCLADMVAIVADSNGEYWYFGYDEPVAANGGTGQTGQAKGDGNFYQITLKDESNAYPYPISKTLVTDLADYPEAPTA